MTAIRLALSMFVLQASIGAVNDLVDAPLDALQKPAKPIPARLVSRPVARVWAGATGVLGLALAAPSGPATVAVAALGAGLGYAYDLGLSRTTLSWLPLTVALPLLPVFAWLGATGTVPPALGTLVPAALLAGSGLALGNGLVDIDRDAAVGKSTVAVRIGRNRAWAVHAAALLGAVAFALLLAPNVPAGLPGASVSGSSGALAMDMVRIARAMGIPAGSAAIALGIALLAARRANVRERGWELEALGTAALALGWLAGVASVAAAAAGGVAGHE
jgi:4-hydroxybenzoate polyprenyltransferase